MQMTARRKKWMAIYQNCVCVCVHARVRQTYPSLQAIPLPQCQCVSLGNNWDNVDFAVDGLHKLYIQRLKTSKEKEN